MQNRQSSPNSMHHYGRRKNSNKKFLPTVRISDAIREALRPRFKWRPYVFRCYFATQLLMAESRGKIPHDFGIFWMGHKGSIGAKYTTNKGVLPEELINEMREAFERSEEFLDMEENELDPIIKQREDIQISIAKATPDQLGMMQDRSSQHQVATSEEAEQMILDGWLFVGTLPNGKVVLKR